MKPLHIRAQAVKLVSLCRIFLPIIALFHKALCQIPTNHHLRHIPSQPQTFLNVRKIQIKNYPHLLPYLFSILPSPHYPMIPLPLQIQQKHIHHKGLPKLCKQGSSISQFRFLHYLAFWQSLRLKDSDILKSTLKSN